MVKKLNMMGLILLQQALDEGGDLHGKKAN